MKRKELKAKWQVLSEQMLEDVAGWREEHPKATIREIESAIDERLFPLRAKMLADAAEGSGEKGQETRRCPKCGARMLKKGKKKRQLLLREGQVVELERENWVCLACGRSLFPPG